MLMENIQLHEVGGGDVEMHIASVFIATSGAKDLTDRLMQIDGSNSRKARRQILSALADTTGAAVSLASPDVIRKTISLYEKYCKKKEE